MQLSIRFHQLIDIFIENYSNPALWAKEVNLGVTVKWFEESWSKVSTQTIENCFKKCGLGDFNHDRGNGCPDMEVDITPLNNAITDLRDWEEYVQIDEILVPLVFDGD